MKRGRIYYVPGMISLVFLPVLCYFYLIPYNKTERCLEITMPDKYSPKNIYENKARFNTSVLSLAENKRNYVSFVLNGNKETTHNKLDSFDNRLQVLICQKDTLNGLHLVFGDGFTYGSFIKALNICYKDSFASFMVYENQLWYLFKNKDAQLKERIKTRRKERSLSEHINNENKEIALNKSSLIEKYKGLIKIWPALIVFGFLGFLSFRSIRNKYSGPNHTNCKRI